MRYYPIVPSSKLNPLQKFHQALCYTNGWNLISKWWMWWKDIKSMQYNPVWAPILNPKRQSNQSQNLAILTWSKYPFKNFIVNTWKIPWTQSKIQTLCPFHADSPPPLVPNCSIQQTEPDSDIPLSSTTAHQWIKFNLRSMNAVEPPPLSPKTSNPINRKNMLY